MKLQKRLGQMLGASIKACLFIILGFVALTLPISGWDDWCRIMTKFPAFMSQTAQGIMTSTAMGMLVSTLCVVYLVVIIIYSQKE